MHFLASNIRLLRKRKRLSQEDLANALGVTRSVINSYENKLADPPLPVLLKIAEFFKISLDRLVRQNLCDLRESELSEIERGLDMDFLGRRLRVLTTTVDSDRENLTELVPERAKAGYTTGYSDPDFIRDLPIMQLPFLSKNRKYRAFAISGDSMPPVPHGSIVIGEYVGDWTSVRSDVPYIVVTRSEGIVFKLLKNQLIDRGTFMFASLNPAYKPYEMSADEILEIWKFQYFISSELWPAELTKDSLARALQSIQVEISEIKKLLKS